jgi:branched-chain amino acid transport system substrate-binding protein
LALAGCGSSSKSSTATTTTPASTSGATQAATGSPIYIEQILDYAPQDGYNLQEQYEGAKAGVDWINQHGGIDGHPLDFSECRTALSVNDAIACANSAIANTKVVALVANNINESADVDPLLDQANLANIGDFALTATDYTSKTSFPAGIGAEANAGAAALLVDYLHAKVLHAMTLSADPGSIESIDAVNAALAARGTAKVSKDVSVPITAQDVTSQAEQVASGANGIIAPLAPGTLALLLKAMGQLGLSTPVAVPALECQPCNSTLSSVGSPVHNLYFADAFVSANGTTPGIKAFQQQLTADGVTSSDSPNEQEEYAWVGVQLFKAAALAAQSETGSITRASVLAAMNKMTNFQIPGVTPVINFTVPNTSFGGTIPRLFNTTVIFAKVNQNGTNTPVTGQFVNAFSNS